MKRLIVIVLAAGLTACAEDGRDREAVTTEAGREDRPVAGDPASTGDRAGAGATDQRRVVYVDVRQPDEWASERVEGAIHIPHTELAERWSELEEYRDADIVLYCRTGRRSGIAEEILREAGFERLHNGGGLTDLQRQGVPTER